MNHMDHKRTTLLTTLLLLLFTPGLLPGQAVLSLGWTTRTPGSSLLRVPLTLVNEGQPRISSLQLDLCYPKTLVLEGALAGPSMKEADKGRPVLKGTTGSVRVLVVSPLNGIGASSALPDGVVMEVVFRAPSAPAGDTIAALGMIVGSDRRAQQVEVVPAAELSIPPEEHLLPKGARSRDWAFGTILLGAGGEE